jgi:HK97 family phage prohead protease
VQWDSIAKPSGGQPTRFAPGAFRGVDASRVRLLHEHDASHVVGVITSLREDAVGLLMEAALARTPLGLETAELTRSGSLTDISVGFNARKAHMEKRSGVGMLRVVMEATLLECSTVNWGADQQARIVEPAHREMSIERMAEVAEAG